MKHIVNGLMDPVTKVQVAAIRCLHSLSRSVQVLRTSFADHNVWKSIVKVGFLLLFKTEYVAAVAWEFIAIKLQFHLRHSYMQMNLTVSFDFNIRWVKTVLLDI